MEGNTMGGNRCGCMHHSILPLLIVAFGALFLLGQMGVFTQGFVDIGWPVLVILGGAMKLMSKKCKCC